MNGSGLGILIEAKLDLQKTVANVNADLKKLASQVQALNLNIDTSNLTKNINQQLSKINNQGKGFNLDTNLDEIPNDIENVNKFVAQLKKNFNATSASIKKEIDVANNVTKSWLVTLKQADGITRSLRLSPTPDGQGFRPQFLTIDDKSEEASLKRAKEAIALVNKRREEADKLYRVEQKTTKEIEQRLEFERYMAANRVQDFRRRYSPVITADQNKQLDSYVQSMNRLSATTPDVSHRIRMLNAEFNRVSTSIKEAGSKTESFASQLKVAMSRIPIWMVGMTAFYAPLRAMQDAIQQIIDLDSQMVVLERVSNGMINVNQAMEDSIGIAERLGNTISQVNDGLIAFARQGYRGDDLTAITEVATIMGNVSDLEIEDSASALTAAMKGFNIEAQNSIRIVDALNEVDNNYSITTQQLAQSLQKSAGSAAVYGLSLEKTIGYTTAIGEVTRESGNIIGNAIKSFSSRITSVNGAITALADVGVSIKDTSGAMRDVDDILFDLSQKWNHLTREQKQNLGLQIAGRFQLSRFLILMENFDQALKVSETALNSQGSAYRENEAYLNSYEAKINRVKNAWTETAITMNEGFVGDALVSFTSITTDLIQGFTKVIDTVGLLPVAFGTATLAFAAFNRETMMLRGMYILDFFKTLPAKIALTGTSATAASVGMTTFSRASAMVSGALTTLKASLASLGTFLVGAALPIAGFMALGAAISWVTGEIAKNNQRREEWQRLNEQSVNTLTTEKDKVTQLASEYEKLSGIGVNRNIEQEQRYVELQNELGAILPSIVEGEDEKGNKILANTSVVNDHIEALEKQIEYQRELARLSAEPNIEVNKNKITEAREEIQKLQDDIAKYQERQTEAARSGNLDKAEQIGIWITGWMADIKELNDDIVGYSNSIVESYAAIAQEQKNLTVEESTWVGQLATETELTINQTKELSNQVAALKPILGDGFDFSGLSYDQFNELNNIAQQVKNGSSDWNLYKQSLKDVGVESSQVTQILGYLKNTQQDLTNSANEHGVSIRSHKPIFDDFGNVINWISKEFDEASDSIDELLEAYDNATSTIKDLNGIINELNEGNGLSSDTIGMLIEKYPNLLQYISNEAELRKQVEKAVREEAEVSQQAVLQKLQHNQQFFNQVLKGNQEFFSQLAKNYGIDLSNFKSLAQAKAQVESQLLQSLASKWGQYYRIQADGTAQLYGANVDSLTRGAMQGSSEANKILMDMNKQVKAYNSVISGLNSVASSSIGVNFSGIGLKTPSASKGSKGSSKKESDAAKKAEEAQRRVLEVVMAQIEAYKRKADALNDDIALEEYYAAKYEETSHQYRQRQANIAKLKKQQADYYKQAITYIEGQLKSNKKLNSEQRIELQKTLVQTKQTYYSTLSAVDSINKEILKSYETIADKVIEAYKEAYEKQKQIAIEANENELRILEDSHNKKIKMLEDELSAYEKLIQAKIDSIDKEKDNEDYAEALAQKQKERLEIQRQIQILSMSDDLSDRKKVRDLEEELKKKDKEIADFVKDRERQLRKESLQEQLEEKREQIEAERELENSYYEDQKHQLEVDRKNIEQYYEDLINDERKFAQIRQQILNDNTKSITDTIKKFSNDIKNNMEIIGKSISNNLLDKLSDAQKLLNGIGLTYKSSTVNTPGGLPSYDTGGFTGKFTGGRLGIFHEEELILNKKDTKNFQKYASLVNSIIPKIPNINIDSPGSNNNAKQNITFSPEFTYLVQGQFDESLAKKYADYTMKEFIGGFQSLGVQFR